MSNFKILFTYSPWLLLLFLPAIALVLVPFFRTSKKYRRTRNRITSMVLHLLIALFSVCTLAGVVFAYDQPNLSNEVVLLVDLSHSNETTEETKDKFIENVLKANDSSFSLGIVIFGRDQYVAANFSSNTDNVLEQYEDTVRKHRDPKTPALIDGSGSNISAALFFAKEMFTDSGSGRIILISDGLETDESAMASIVTVVAEGLIVDTVRFPNKYPDEVQIMGVNFPNENLYESYLAQKTVNITLTLQSSYESRYNFFTDEGGATITLYDNGEESTQIVVDLKIGSTDYLVPHTFTQAGFREIRFTLEADKSLHEQSNIFYSYVFIEQYDKILILERTDEAEILGSFLKEEYLAKERPEENIEIRNIKDAPKTLKELRQFDQVILMNTSEHDMPKADKEQGRPENFVDILKKYVEVYGGGLLTVGGKIDDKNIHGETVTVPHIYDVEKMRGTTLQNMIPVTCEYYTPPVAVMLIIDVSGSMDTIDNKTRGRMRIEEAIDGAITAVGALSRRDYIGLISFSDSATLEIPFTLATQSQTINATIRSLRPLGGTNYDAALNLAKEHFRSQSLNVKKRHIIFISDGEPTVGTGAYLSIIEELYEEDDITLSAIGMGDVGRGTIVQMAKSGQGRDYFNLDPAYLTWSIKEEIQQQAIRFHAWAPFTPSVYSWGSPEMRGINATDTMPQFSGFYGSNAKSRSTTVIMDEDKFVPVYAKWNFGNGKVGSLMTDLNDDSAKGFLSDPSGSKFILNVIRFLSPAVNIKEREIGVNIYSDNYTKIISVVPTIESPLLEGETFDITVAARKNQDFTEQIHKFTLNRSARATFDISLPGLYQVMVEKKDKDGNLIGNPEFYYTAFSYSNEYNIFLDQDKALLFLEDLAKEGRGRLLEASDPALILKPFRQFKERTFDPRILFIIIAVSLFLLDIAVRKFKWKWPWEIVRDYKTKKKLRHLS